MQLTPLPVATAPILTPLSGSFAMAATGADVRQAQLANIDLSGSLILMTENCR